MARLTAKCEILGKTISLCLQANFTFLHHKFVSSIFQNPQGDRRDALKCFSCVCWLSCLIFNEEKAQLL